MTHAQTHTHDDATAKPRKPQKDEDDIELFWLDFHDPDSGKFLGACVVPAERENFIEAVQVSPPLQVQPRRAGCLDRGGKPSSRPARISHSSAQRGRGAEVDGDHPAGEADMTRRFTAWVITAGWITIALSACAPALYPPVVYAPPAYAPSPFIVPPYQHFGF